MYDYNSEIRYENEKSVREDVLAVTKRVKKLIEYRQKLIER